MGVTLRLVALLILTSFFRSAREDENHPSDKKADSGKKSKDSATINAALNPRDIQVRRVCHQTITEIKTCCSNEGSNQNFCRTLLTLLRCLFGILIHKEDDCLHVGLAAPPAGQPVAQVHCTLRAEALVT